MKKEKNTGKSTQNNEDKTDNRNEYKNEKKNDNVIRLNEKESKDKNEANEKNMKQTVFNAQRFFVKKMDFSVLMDAATLAQNKSQKKPELNINISLNNIPLEDDRYEVDLLIKTNATQDEKPLFAGSVEEAGIFTLKNFNPAEKDFILRGYCPTLLFPYIKENLANLMMRSGYVPIELPVIDFIGLYQKSLQDANAKESDPKNNK